MNILLTNDDGYRSEGIRALFATLSAKHKVWLCAPLRQMSATSHAITLFKPMEILRLADNDHALDGTPADCVKVALFHLYKDVRFDMIVSGVNEGPNMGDDIFYSGTVAGAREGSMNRIFAIAASMDGWNGGYDFKFAASFIDRVVDSLNGELLAQNIVLNVNFPRKYEGKGVRITHLGERVYKDFIKTEMRDGKAYLTIAGDDPGFAPHDGSDLDAVSEGLISITPLVNELFDAGLIEKLRYLEKI